MEALIVDDEQDIGLMVSKFLNGEGIKCTCVFTISDARASLAQKNFDIHFLDLNLPDGSGFDLIPSIREKNQKAKVIVISAYDGTEENTKATELEVDTFIKKPFSKNEVLLAATK